MIASRTCRTHSSVITCVLLFLFLFFYCYGDHRDLHSFPTRRSSDLGTAGDGLASKLLPRAARGQNAARRRRPLRSRSEEHTSELQSLRHVVCRLRLEKKKTTAE